MKTIITLVLSWNWDKIYFSFLLLTLWTWIHSFQTGIGINILYPQYISIFWINDLLFQSKKRNYLLFNIKILQNIAKYCTYIVHILYRRESCIKNILVSATMALPLRHNNFFGHNEDHRSCKIIFKVQLKWFLLLSINPQFFIEKHAYEIFIFEYMISTIYLISIVPILDSRISCTSFYL